MRILVVEDETDLGVAVAEHLRVARYTVDLVDTLEDAFSAVRGTNYALVLLDLKLPDGDGLSFLRDLRDQSDPTPILILTARDRITERIAGLEAGADDYLVKPFDLDEMLARVTAILRRVDGNRKPERVFGTLRILPANSEVELDGRPVMLTRREWAILDRLSRRPDLTISRTSLEEDVYGFGEEVASNAIEAHVSRLRSKLGSNVVKTVRGFGYRMGSV